MATFLDKILAATRAPRQPQTAPDGEQLVNTPADIMPPHATAGQAIGGLFAPEAGSFWQQATKFSPLLQARAGQVDYQQAQEAAARKAATEQLVLDEATRKTNSPLRDDITVGGRIVRPNFDTGEYQEAYEPEPLPSEVERLIEQWKVAPEGPLKALIERAIRGYQYGMDYITASSAAKKDQIITNNKTKRFAPKGRSSTGVSSGGLPDDAVVLAPGVLPPGAR